MKGGCKFSQASSIYYRIPSFRMDPMCCGGFQMCSGFQVFAWILCAVEGFRCVQGSKFSHGSYVLWRVSDVFRVPSLRMDPMCCGGFQMCSGFQVFEYVEL